MPLCFGSSRNKNSKSPPKTAVSEPSIPMKTDIPIIKTKDEILIRIPGATVHLMEDGETTQLAQGELTVVRLTENNVVLATIIKVGTDLQWPLTKDEPVVKVDELHYLFSLPSSEGDFLNYGISFSKPNGGLAMFDAFLTENSCISLPPNLAAAASSSNSPEIYWKDYAPRIEGYNGILAKAIAQGTGEIVKGIFKCSNAYANKVQNGGEMVRAKKANGNGLSTEGHKSNQSTAKEKKSELQKSIKRVKKLSKMTEKMSKSLLNGVAFVSGSVAKPLVQSKAGKAILATVPGEVLLASLDAIDNVLDALEVAERQALSATTGAVTGMVTQRYGENAGDMAGDMLATAGHAAGTAWNIFKLRKAINPASSLPSAAVKNAIKKR